MTTLFGYDPGFIAGVAVALSLLVAISGIGVKLVTSTRAADRHLANGAALTTAAPHPVASGANTVPPSAEAVFARARADDVASRRRFSEQLSEYYAANISQGNAIFWASLLAMSVGFAIIFVGIATAGRNPVTAIVAGAAGVLSQFIGATFLVVLRSTQAQSTAYAQTLVELQLHDARAAAEARAIGIGLALVNEMAADGARELANQTRAALATGLIVKGAPPLTGTASASPVTVVAVPAESDGGSHVAAKPPARAHAESVTFDSGPTGLQS